MNVGAFRRRMHRGVGWTLVSACLVAAMAVAQAGPGLAELLLRGRYEGKNLLIVNPDVPEVGSCITQVLVNGTQILPGTAAVIEVHLDALRLRLTDPVTVRITHRSTCTPKVLNPEVIQPRPQANGAAEARLPLGSEPWAGG